MIPYVHIVIFYEDNIILTVNALIKLITLTSKKLKVQDHAENLLF